MENSKIQFLKKNYLLFMAMLAFTLIVHAQTANDNPRERLWQAFLTPPDSIRVGCYYYWVNEQVDPKGVVADLEWMKENGITLAFLATDIRNQTTWDNPWEGQADSIFSKFRQRFGYELDYTNPACQKDLDRLIADLVASEYMGGLTEKAHEYGLRTWCEPYAHSPFPANSITYGSAADEVAAEFWVDDRKFRQKEVDAALGSARRSQHASDLKPLVTYLRRCNFMLQLGKPLDGANDRRILNDGTKIRFTEESFFEVTFPDGRQEYWNPAQPQPSATAMPEQLQFSKAIVSGVSWYDQHGETVSAHGANIIRDGGKYYLFGEYKTDSANVFKGFSCYSSDNLTDWHFEGIVFDQQPDGRMGPDRVGERPKVLRCPATGEYVMLMHTDNLQYKDPCTCYATSQTITGPYEFQGPLLYKGEPVRKWDIGSFADDDGHAYLLVHHGIIYRLATDFHSLDSCLMNGLKGAGESPAMLKKDGTYYWLSSHTTSWERNDNMYWTSNSLSGPWEYRGEFCPKGSLTWNSQCSFVLPLENGSFMYMGDRWSFPRQRSAATYVWQPLTIADGKLTIPHYYEAWDPLTMQQEIVNSKKLHEKKWQSQVIGDSLSIPYTGRRIALYGTTDNMSGYADITIRDQRGHKVFGGIIDFYSLVPATGIRFLSPMLAKGKYTLELRIASMKPNWTDKRRNQYGSTGHKVEITHVMIE